MADRDYRQFFDVFRKETDRACAILARALLEELLRRVVEAGFVADTPANDRKELLEGQGPLATFSARIRLAECLGMITKREGSDLHLVRKIANEFAHNVDHALTFELPAVRDRALALHFAKGLVENAQVGIGEQAVSQQDLDEIKTKPRRRFEIGVSILWFVLNDRACKRIAAQEPAPLVVGF